MNHDHIEDLYPLSPMQKGMLFHSLYAPQAGEYITQSTGALHGTLNVEAFRQAWQQVMDRNAILRTAFIWEELEEPVQVVCRGVSLPLVEYDWRSLSAEDQETQLAELLEEERLRGFDLAEPPLMRLVLIRLEDDVYQFVWSHHHVLLDGWSLSLLIHEIFTYYETINQGIALSLPPNRPFRDYIAWLQRQDRADAEAFWRKSLHGFREPTPLGERGNNNRVLSQAQDQGEEILRLSREKTDGLQTLAQQTQLTLNTLVQGAVALLLRAYSGKDDVVFGSVVSGRPADLSGVETMIGLFINTLPVRVAMTPDESLLAYLKRLHAEQVEMRQYEYTPLVDIHRWSDMPQGNPLFESFYVFENYPKDTPGTESADMNGAGATQPSAVQIRAYQVLERSNYPLVFSTGPSAELSLTILYDRHRFASETIAAMRTHLQKLLESFETHLDQPISALPLVDQHRFGRQHAGALDQELLDLAEISNLTANELQVWLGQKVHGNSPLYNDGSFAFIIPAHVDLEHFQAAFQTLVNSCDALRTIFVEEGGVPQRRILDQVAVPRDYEDFSESDDPYAAFRSWACQQSQIIFNMEEPLWRSTLIKLEEEKYVWFLMLHQIISDDTVFEVIFTQMAALYQQSLDGELDERIDLPSSQVLVDQADRFRSSPRYEAAERFWQEKLADRIDPMTFYGRVPTIQTTEVKRISCNLGHERTQRLKALATEKGIASITEDTSLFNLFAALLATYLYRISGNQTLSIGVPFHNRTGKDLREIVGLCMQVAPLRITVDPNATLPQLAKTINRTLFETLRYSQYPIANAANDRVFDVILNYHLARFERFGGVPVETDWIYPDHGHGPMTLQVYDYADSGSLTLDFDLHCDLFDEAQRNQVAAHFLQLVDDFLDAQVNESQRDESQRDESQSRGIQTRTIADVNILSMGERKQILLGLNDSAVAFPAQPSIHTLFEAQVARVPDATAVVFEGEALTYAQLNAQANQLAHYLQAHGVGPEVRVAISLHRSLEMIVGVMGILKAGGAYVPLDPEYPQERLAFMLDDSQASILLTDSTISASMPEAQVEIILIDQLQAEIAQQPSDNPSCVVTGTNLLYMIYTSGSTGRAKGVMVTHANLVNAFYAWQLRYDLDAVATSHLQMASFSFDVFNGDLARALCTGGKLVVCPRERLLEPEQLYELMQNESVDCAEFVPVVLRGLAQYLDETRQTLDFVRMLVVGSDSWYGSDHRQISRLCGAQTRFVNSYGTTEATIDSSFYEDSTAVGDSCLIDGAFQESDSLVPIGQPLPNMAYFILDADGQPVPISMPGELFIGGAGITRGYHNQPALTAERFVPHPFSQTLGERLYRTGDMALLRADGQVEFLGRIDNQVKVRGFRVELGEIEAALTQHAVISEAVVLLREDLPGDKKLVAYLVSPSGDIPSVGELREFLSTSLPDYMIPALFVTIDSVPVTPNGKVDRKALPRPDQSKTLLDDVFVPPQNHWELQLSHIWSEVLGIDAISATANFFDLGGHSILAIRLMAKIREHFQRDLPLATLFEASSIRGLARVLASDAPALPRSTLVPIQPHGSRPALFCIHAIGGEVLNFLDLAHHLGTEQPFYGIQAPTPADVDGQFLTIAEMASNYVQVIREVQPEGPYLLAGLCYGGVIAFEIAQQLTQQGCPVAMLSLLDTWSPVLVPDYEDYAQLLVENAQYLARLNQVELGITLESIRQLEPEQQVMTVLKRVKEANLVPTEIGIDWLRRYLEGYKLRSDAFHQYVPTPYTGAISLFRAGSRSEQQFAEFAEQGMDIYDETQGWGEVAVGHFNNIQVPGYHETMCHEPHVQVLAEQLTTCIKDALQKPNYEMSVGTEIADRALALA